MLVSTVFIEHDVRLIVLALFSNSIHDGIVANFICCVIFEKLFLLSHLSECDLRWACRLKKFFRIFIAVGSKPIFSYSIGHGPAGNRTRDSSVQAKYFTTRLQAQLWCSQSACTRCLLNIIEARKPILISLPTLTKFKILYE